MLNRLIVKLCLAGLFFVSFQTLQAAELAPLSIQYKTTHGKTAAPPCRHLGFLACALTLYTNGPSVTVTITNNSSVVTALNIAAHLAGTALDGNVTATSCPVVPPKTSCNIVFTPLSTPVPTTAFTVSGTNTDSLPATMQIIMPTLSYTVGGSVTGLVGTVVLQNNGTDNLSINADGGFTFATPIVDGNPYNVTVLTQPATQTCVVTNGSGTISGANVTNVDVTCTTNTTTLSVPATGTIPLSAGCVTTNTITVTNTGAFTALNVHAQLPWVTGITQDASACTALPATQSCDLVLCSTIPYIAAGSIPIVADNVPSPPTMALAFTSNGYYVVSVESGTNATIVDNVDVASSRWAGVSPGTATSLTDGAGNTAIIIATPSANPSAANNCNNSVNGGASVGTWYLPAICQMGGNGEGAGCSSGTSTFSNLVQLGYLPSSNGVVYWSSTEVTSPVGAWNEQAVYPGGSSQLGATINVVFNVRCMRSITY